MPDKVVRQTIMTSLQLPVVFIAVLVGAGVMQATGGGPSWWTVLGFFGTVAVLDGLLALWLRPWKDP